MANRLARFLRLIVTPFIAMATLGAVESTAHSDIGSQLEVDAGSTATVTLTITVETAVSTETQSRTTTLAVGGGGNAIFLPDQEPFTFVELTQLQFLVENGSLDYEFFCGTFFGCVDLNVTIADLAVTLVDPTSASIIENGRADFNATWNLTANYAFSSSLFSGDGPLDTTSDIGFGGNFLASDGEVLVDQLTLGTIVSDVPGDGTIAISIVTDVNLSGATLSGTYEELPPESCGGGGVCGAEHGPGCDDVACCAAVCEIDFYCCEVNWDASCVNKAVELCGVTPANDDCGDARPLGLGRFPFTNLNCSNEGPPVTSECTSIPFGGALVNDVWFTHTALADNGVLVSTCGHADFDTQIQIYDGCDGNLIACNQDSPSCPGGTSLVGFMGVEGETYWIRVSGVDGAGFGEIDIAWGDVDDPYDDLAVEWSPESGGNGHFYALYALGEQSTYARAIEVASAFGGYPATITSPRNRPSSTGTCRAPTAVPRSDSSRRG